MLMAKEINQKSSFLTIFNLDFGIFKIFTNHQFLIKSFQYFRSCLVLLSQKVLIISKNDILLLTKVTNKKETSSDLMGSQSFLPNHYYLSYFEFCCSFSETSSSSFHVFSLRFYLSGVHGNLTTESVNFCHKFVDKHILAYRIFDMLFLHRVKENQQNIAECFL